MGHNKGGDGDTVFQMDKISVEGVQTIRQCQAVGGIAMIKNNGNGGKVVKGAHILRLTQPGRRNCKLFLTPVLFDHQEIE